MFRKPLLPCRSACQTLLVLVSAWLLCASASAQPSGRLNDTGQTQCDNGSNVLSTCSLSNTGDASTLPRQDGRFGRDVAGPTKVGGGAAGFDFTPLDVSGNAIALTGSPAVPAATPSCVKDNLTNLIWEVKTSSGLQNSSHTYAWGNNSGADTCGGAVSTCNTDAYIAALNAANLCGQAANDWRLPTRRELQGLVHLGKTLPPMIDTDFFPATPSDLWYWTNDPYATSQNYAWIVGFNFGGSYAYLKANSYYVRLVRSGP